MGQVSSWRLKLARAEQHVDEFNALVDEYVASHAYEVITENAQDEGRLRYSLAIDPPPAEWAVIIGDALFNFRSALDHLASAFDPKSKATYPITTHDIEALDPSGTYLHGDARRAYRDKIKGAPASARAVIQGTQPYHFVLPDDDPADHALAILNTLNNADKHARLTVGAQGLRDPLLILNGVAVPREEEPSGDGKDPLENGAELITVPAEVDVKIVGTLVVAVRVGPKSLYEATTVLTTIQDFIGTEIVEPLEALL